MHGLKIILLPVFIACFGSTFLCQAKDGESSHLVAIRPVDFDRPPCLASTWLGFEQGSSQFAVEDLQSGEIYLTQAAQLVHTGKGSRVHLSWVVKREIKANESPQFRLFQSAEMPQVEDVFDCRQDASALHMGFTDSPVFRYNKRPTAEASQHEPFYSRTGYIHPLYSPSGKVVTGDFEPDHKHQHGLFHAWTRTRYQGKKAEFWNQKLQLGSVQFESGADGFASGAAFCRFSARHSCRLAEPGNPVVLDETWAVTLHNLPTPYRVFDIVVRQTNPTDSPLTIEKYHYGGMAFRGPSEWLAPSKEADPPAEMLTDQGLTRAEGNHSRPNWVALSGPIQGESCGIAVLSSPENFRAPQWVRLHPSKPYFVFAPMVEEPFQIVPGGEPTGNLPGIAQQSSIDEGDSLQVYQSQFRYVVFDGQTDADLLDRLFQNYANPPQVEPVKN